MIEELNTLKFKGTQVAYFVVCERKLWLFTKGVSFEHTSEKVALGKFLDEVSFKREQKLDLCGEPVSIDFITTAKGIVINEIKHSDALQEAHILQVKYYIFYLKNKGISVSHGVLHYPKQKRIVRVDISREDEKLIKEALEKMDHLLSLPKPPQRINAPYCKKCAYYEFCYG
ncbi:MAG: CRISPR-associated protein Cas4 [Hydrogenobacter sp.]|uniref:CRISPR-associated protein Cas4 n=1 Tax=Hydrogenobacter thermophilus TaxID=940 RepID=UPI0030F954E2